MATKQAPLRSKIGLKGSTKICTEFFSYSVNSILFQRGIYPPEDFKLYVFLDLQEIIAHKVLQSVKKYGLNMLVTMDDAIKGYIDTIMKQLSKWLMEGKVSQLVLAISGKESGETLERWQFDIQTSEEAADQDKENSNSLGNSTMVSEQPVKTKIKTKSEKEINMEIQAIIRQITASVTFLPIIDEPCTFKILVYVDNVPDAIVPDEWKDSDAHLITGENAERVTLRSFDTSVHRVEAMLAYRVSAE